MNPRLFRAEPLQRCKLGECRAACCQYGVWVDKHEREQILSHAERIGVQMEDALRDPAAWFDGRADRDEFSASGEVFHTAVISERSHYSGTACVFLRADHKCALQCAAIEAGHHPWRWKPFYCVLHPLDLDDEGRITLVETAELLAEEASCLRACDRLVPLWETFAEELRYLIGEEAYQTIHKGLNPE